MVELAVCGSTATVERDASDQERNHNQKFQSRCPEFFLGVSAPPLGPLPIT